MTRRDHAEIVKDLDRRLAICERTGMTATSFTVEQMKEIRDLLSFLPSGSPAPPTGAPTELEGYGGPIPLNPQQEQAAKEWAADDRLWTTQETVEVNLRTFARMILKHATGSPTPEPLKAENERLKAAILWIEAVIAELDPPSQGRS